MRNPPRLKLTFSDRARPVDAIRARYPNPTPPAAGGSYCVGGALLLYYASHLVGYRRARRLGFPPSVQIAGVLELANPQLDRRLAEHFATQIVTRNDAYQIDAAWATLDRALRWRGKPERAGV
ncbi:MAG: hypothetical protein GWN95_20700 [Gammaproteobacteria bacterium]|nr:hypothetical protein [Gammaproteobacteria bacterium]